MEFDTAEGQRIRVVAITRALEYPFSATFLPDGSMLVTERASRLRIIRNGVLDPKPVAGGPAAFSAGGPGLARRRPRLAWTWCCIPALAGNHRIVRSSYTKSLTMTHKVAALARGRWDGTKLTETKDIFVTEGTGPARVAFG